MDMIWLIAQDVIIPLLQYHKYKLNENASSFCKRILYEGKLSIPNLFTTFLLQMRTKYNVNSYFNNSNLPKIQSSFRKNWLHPNS